MVVFNVLFLVCCVVFCGIIFSMGLGVVRVDLGFFNYFSLVMLDEEYWVVFFDIMFNILVCSCVVGEVVWC